MYGFFNAAWQCVAVFEDDIGLWALCGIQIGPADGCDGIKDGFDDYRLVDQWCEQRGKTPSQCGATAKANQYDMLDGGCVIGFEVS